MSGGGASQSGGGAVLTVGPKPGTPVTEPTVRLSEVATSSKLSLLAYEQRFHPSSAQVPALLQQVSTPSTYHLLARCRKFCHPYTLPPVTVILGNRRF